MGVFFAPALLRFGQRCAASPPSAQLSGNEKSIPYLSLFLSENSIKKPSRFEAAFLSLRRRFPKLDGEATKSPTNVIIILLMYLCHHFIRYDRMVILVWISL